MSDDRSSTADPIGTDPKSRAARRRRLDEVFGDVLPDTTEDERDAGVAGIDSDSGPGEASDRWLREQVPPHHG
jgi:hypothetical protein